MITSLLASLSGENSLNVQRFLLACNYFKLLYTHTVTGPASLNDGKQKDLQSGIE